MTDQGAELPYEERHIDAIRYAFIEETIPPGEWLALSDKLSVCWGRSGHLPGSIWLLLNMEGSLAFFSGDYTSESALLAAEIPSIPNCGEANQSGLQEYGSIHAAECVELSIVEAAYGMDEDSQEHKLAQLKEVVGVSLQQQETVLLPVPTYGRGQELLLWALDTFPHARIVVEREIVDVLGQMLDWPEWLKENAAQCIVDCLSDERLLVVDCESEREQALADSVGVIVFTNDGMMQSAKCRWYYNQLRLNGGYRVVLTGHLAKGSLGQRLLNGEERGEGGSRVHLVRYKVHQGLPDVKAMLDAVPAKQTVLVHAGKASTDDLCGHLRNEGYEGLNSMATGEVLVVQLK